MTTKTKTGSVVGPTEADARIGKVTLAGDKTLAEPLTDVGHQESEHRQQMDVARRVMRENSAVLRELAK